MNIKMKSIIAVLTMSAAVFAAETPAPTAVRAADAAPAAEAPAAEPAAPVAEAAPAEAAAPAEVAPAAETAPVEPMAPTAVRDGAAPVATAPAAESAPAPVSAPAPTTQRRVDPDTLPPATVYRTVYAPVKTVYVSQEESQGDTVSLDELRGLVPFKMSLGVQAFLGTYSLYDYSYYDDSFFDLSLRAGLTSIIPLNKYTVAMKVGAIYEQSKASSTLYYTQGFGSSRKETKYHVSFKERKIDIPVLFSFKSPHSNVMFDIGAQPSIAIYDKMSIKEGNNPEQRIDMIDEDFRNTMDWSLVFGMEFRANKYVAMNLRFDCGLSSLYDSFDHSIIKIDDLTSNAFLVGLTFYFL